MVWVRGYRSLGGSLTPCFPGAQSRAVKSPTVQLLLVTCPLCPPYSVGNGQETRGGRRERGAAVSILFLSFLLLPVIPGVSDGRETRD